MPRRGRRQLVRCHPRADGARFLQVAYHLREQVRRLRDAELDLMMFSAELLNEFPRVATLVNRIILGKNDGEGLKRVSRMFHSKGSDER